MTNRVNILDIPIDNISRKGLKTQIDKSIQNRTKLFIATVNASFIYKSLSNPLFKEILNATEINTADGISVQLSAEYLMSLPKSISMLKPVVNLLHGFKIGIYDFLLMHKKFKIIQSRITGVDITKDLLDYAQKNKKSICIIHRVDSILSDVELTNFVKKNYPNLSFNILLLPVGDDKVDLKQTNYDIYLCTLGEFFQEKVLYNLYLKNKSGVYVGIGSTFDILSFKISNIDDKYKQMGLEWLIRLVTRPKRFKKIFRSVVLFPVKIYVHSLHLS